MRSKVVKMLALALVLGGVGITLAQAPPVPPGQPKQSAGSTPRPKRKAPAKKSKLEEMLAEALKNNADIRVAAANVTLAEAELDRTRFQVTQKVLTLYHAIQSQKATVEYEEKQCRRMHELLNQRAVEAKLVGEREEKLIATKAKLAELEAQMTGLLGKSARDEGMGSDSLLGDNGRVRLYPLVGLAELIRTPRGELELKLKNLQRATGPLAERMRKALQTPVKVDYTAMPFRDVLRHLEDTVPGLSIKCFARLADTKVNVNFKDELPVSAFLQALADSYDMRFLVREYGILVTSQADNTPPGAMTVEEFLRQKPAEK